MCRAGDAGGRAGGWPAATITVQVARLHVAVDWARHQHLRLPLMPPPPPPPHPPTPCTHPPVQAVDLKAAQDRVVAAQAEYARGLSGLRSANAELQALSSRVLSSEKAANGAWRGGGQGQAGRMDG